MSRVFLWAVLCIPCLAMAAEQEQIPPPEPPFVAPMPEMMRVEISLDDKKNDEEKAQNQANGANGNAPMIFTPSDVGDSGFKSIEITRTESIRKVVVNLKNGEKQESWMLSGLVYTEPEHDGRVARRGFGPLMPQYLNPASNEFYGLDWLAIENYKGVETYKGKKCYFFQKTSGPPKAALPVENKEENELVTVDMTGVEVDAGRAWIDVETRLPVAATLSEGLCAYKFFSPPQNILQPPSKIFNYDREMREMDAQMKRDSSAR